jgi:diacylglycerol O-acyltransferase / wax synthase
VSDRLTPLDASFLYLEEPTTAMHVGSVGIFEPPEDGFDYDTLHDLIGARIAYVPRYRQRIRSVPGRLGNPVWVDDENFDLSYHVRRSALPRPGSDEQLHELVARIQSRRLDRKRPLWEVYLVEGLADGRFAIISKAHQAMVDGINAVDIAQVILDPSPEPRPTPVVAWRPAAEPSWFELVAGAVADAVRRPTAVLDTVRSGVGDVTATAGKVADAAVGLFAAARTAARPAPHSPLNREIGEQRRCATVRTDLEDYKRIRRRHGGTINDVVLATVTGALRAWLLTRATAVTSRSTVRALLPVSVRLDGEASDSDGHVLGNRVASFLVDLPVGEPSPVVRLHQVSYAMRAHKESGVAVGADALVQLSGFAPPTLHSLGARVTNSLSKRLFNLVVTNVPGPQFPLYAGGARMLEAYPVMPLAKGQAVSIGVTSYDGGVYYGINADRDAMPDVDVLADCVVEALAELGAAADRGSARSDSTPGRAASGRAASGRAASGRPASRRAAAEEGAR